MIAVEDLKFDKDGLIPAVIVSDETDQVLMLAWMNEESLRLSIEKKLTCFWSRSRNELWTKGETSGNYQHIISITADCDADTLLVRVNPDGPACHLGTTSCFENPVLYYDRDEDDENLSDKQAFSQEFEGRWTIDDLMNLLKERKLEPVEGSYTTYLFEKGLDKILKKVGEESSEVIIAAKNEDKAETVYEIADLVYHTLVLMVESGIGLDEVRDELASRHIIDHKVKQESLGASN